MQTTVEFNGMFSYSYIPIIILIISIIIVCIIFREKKEKITEIIIPKNKNINEIKNKYLELINKLLIDINNNKINNRLAYQKLSKLIRNFIYETTTIKVQYYTLNDIEKINLPILYELVKEYYNPEFSKDSNGNINESINKTKKVIEEWK